MPPKEVKLNRPIKGKGNTPKKSSPNAKPGIAHRPLTRSTQGSPHPGEKSQEKPIGHPQGSPKPREKPQEKPIDHSPLTRSTQGSPHPVENPPEKSSTQKQKEVVHSPTTRKSPRKVKTQGSPQPKQVISHRPITRSRLPNLPSSSASLTADVEVVDVPLMSSSVDGVEIMAEAPVGRLDSMDQEQHGVDNADVPRASADTARESPLREAADGQDADVPSVETNADGQKRRGRGPSRGKSIESAIASNGGKLLEIEFPEGFKKPSKFAKELATGIGIIVRHTAELDYVSTWKSVPESVKLAVYGGLDTWFDIKGWATNPAVKFFIEDMFYTSYRHWKGRLSSAYKHLVETGVDPRTSSPFDWMPLQKWHVLCDHFESSSFQGRSITNAGNRAKMPYTHTSGSKSFASRFLEMEVESRSEVDVFATTHRTRDGSFVNNEVERLHTEMNRMLTDQGEEVGQSMSQREIMQQTLGVRAGYERGMGHGVLPSKRSKRASSEFHLQEVQQQLTKTEKELQEAIALIKSQDEQIRSERQKHDMEIESLKNGQEEIKKMLLSICGRTSSTS